MLNEKEHQQDLLKTEEWLAKQKDLNAVSSILPVLRLNEYLQQTLLPINQYQTEDWSSFFEWAIKSTGSIRSTKNKIKEFLIANQYPEEVVQALENMVKCGGTNYILNLRQLQRIVDEYRENHIGLALKKMGKCDSLTSIEICIYLIWCGIPIKEALQLKRFDIDFENGSICIGNKHFKIPVELQEKFINYNDAPGYWFTADSFGTVAMRPYIRESGVFICKGKGQYKSNSMIKQINNMGLNETFIWRSGRFYSAWERSKVLSPPEITWNKLSEIIDYFELEDNQIKDKWQLMDFKYDWERYCLRQTINQEDKSLVFPRNKRRTKNK